ncbi:maltose acetyltransferase domain-containing protein [Paenibacillus xylanilyticus]|uniref:maltose acetyltransferase domain-containing protein n=1 Tax=Paenibacillus xylanilyticus TaxID=248903 RepID=UPI003AAF2A53
MTEEERILNGILFSPSHPELKAIKLRSHNLSHQYSQMFEDQTEEREAILTQLLGRIGESLWCSHRDRSSILCQLQSDGSGRCEGYHWGPYQFWT